MYVRHLEHTPQCPTSPLPISSFCPLWQFLLFSSLFIKSSNHKYEKIWYLSSWDWLSLLKIRLYTVICILLQMIQFHSLQLKINSTAHTRAFVIYSAHSCVCSIEEAVLYVTLKYFIFIFTKTQLTKNHTAQAPITLS